MPALPRSLFPSALALLALVLVPLAWPAPKYKVLHSFTGGNDGGVLWGSLLLDSKGNAYGTTNYYGPAGGGTVFELSPKRNGTWAETTLYSFCSQSECTDGGGSTAGLIFDESGNIYGTTKLGGSDSSGTVFELSPQGDGTWSENVLYSFDQGPVVPYAGVIMDPSGNLYGTGGTYAYELSPGSGGWGITDLLQLPAPYAGLVRDATGNLYGTTHLGGGSKNCDGGCGTVYKLHAKPDGTWQETILHDFGAPGDGAFPSNGALIMDRTGNLYGTTESGAIYKLSPRPHGVWKETVLYNVSGEPVGGVAMDKAGALYGTTSAGGKAGCGTVYKLAPAAKDQWKYSVLHTFLGWDGCGPAANLILDKKRNLYGTTTLGGTYGVGVAFELTP